MLTSRSEASRSDVLGIDSLDRFVREVAKASQRSMHNRLKLNAYGRHAGWNVVSCFCCACFFLCGGRKCFSSVAPRKTAQHWQRDLVFLLRHESTTLSKQKNEFEKWPRVTGFKNWKTFFRREVITGSTHPRNTRQITVSVIRRRCVFGSNQMSFEILDSQVANSLMSIMNPDCRRQGSGGRRLTRSDNLTILTVVYL